MTYVLRSGLLAVVAMCSCNPEASVSVFMVLVQALRKQAIA